ncbi:hypothetical protein DCS_07751 [Drechmeria coniospora]|uniref:Uncharacterized protein n=1 Tax=Drechmeria coniospora TaxID=98403 RepID=A0A151GFB0_DRECN|nr:hypothetical protein DCS_07751 [Drechmeria coniospora]KYK55787.1 hypothetical protein DCS_07751 [Drechmeria coniospora]
MATLKNSPAPASKARGALTHAFIFFTPEFALEMVDFTPESDVPACLAWYLSDKIIRRVRVRHRFVSSVDKFAKTMSSTFSPYCLEGFRANCQNFDSLVGSTASMSGADGCQKLSEVFIQQQDIYDLIQGVCSSIAHHSWDAAFGAPPLRRRGPIPAAISQLVGSDHASSARPQAGVDDDGGPFKQVTIVGKGIIDAWQRLPFTQQLETDCPQNSTWTPSQPGALSVYHGTSHNPKKGTFNEFLSQPPFLALDGGSSRNHITQGSGQLPVVWTAFSPLRAFLWAVWQAEAVAAVPNPDAKGRLNAVWKCAGKTYEGVMLLQFSASQPQPPGLTSYVIPRGREEEWSKTANSDRYGFSGMNLTHTQTLWAQFSTIHGQEIGSEWPNLVHGLELWDSRQDLRKLRVKQVWRTAWSGEGISRLNENHKQSLAIRFYREAEAETSCPSESEKIETAKRRHSYMGVRKLFSKGKHLVSR